MDAQTIILRPTSTIEHGYAMTTQPNDVPESQIHTLVNEIECDGGSTNVCLAEHTGELCSLEFGFDVSPLLNCEILSLNVNVRAITLASSTSYNTDNKFIVNLYDGDTIVGSETLDFHTDGIPAGWATDPITLSYISILDSIKSNHVTKIGLEYIPASATPSKGDDKTPKTILVYISTVYIEMTYIGDIQDRKSVV